jgi:hypothetical protein
LWGKLFFPPPLFLFLIYTYALPKRLQESLFGRAVFYKERRKKRGGGTSAEAFFISKMEKSLGNSREKREFSG